VVERSVHIGEVVGPIPTGRTLKIMAYIIVLALLIIQSILFAAHFLVYKTIVSVFALSGPNLLLTLRIVLGILSVSFVIASVISSRYYNPVAKIFYDISASWLAFLLYLVLAAGLYWVGGIILMKLSQGAAVAVFGKTLLLLALLVGSYGIFHANDMMVNTVKISLPNLPAVWQGRKAVWVSDLHLGEVRGYDFAVRIVKAMNELKPDLVFVGGDLYDGVAVDENKVVEPFRELKPPLGVYFITGNHEEFGDSTKYIEAVKKVGMKVLSNEAADVEGVKIIGVDFRDASDKKKFSDILNGINIDRNKPSILLKHDPLKLDIAEKAGVSLQVSGHTHRAQLFPLNFLTYLIYRGYDYGLHKFGAMWVYTSDGVGTWGPPARVGTNSEIVLFEF
jgi:uncharacterized protein